MLRRHLLARCHRQKAPLLWVSLLPIHAPLALPPQCVTRVKGAFAAAHLPSLDLADP